MVEYNRQGRLSVSWTCSKEGAGWDVGNAWERDLLARSLHNNRFDQSQSR